eukprot:12896978-Prorocentrum_lima.AAC.2
MWLGNIIEKWWGLFTSKLYDYGFKTYSSSDALWSAAQAVWEETWEEYHTEIPKMIEKVPYYMKRIIEVEGRHLSRKEEREVDKIVRNKRK